MASRMDRYKEERQKENFSRARKNKELYENIGSNARYTNITDVTNANAFNLEEIPKKTTTRESYHKIKEYQPSLPEPKEKKELENFKFLYQDRENRIYDINRVLEDAHKNRVVEDDKEDKRKLKSNSYNIITSLSKEELEQYRKERINKNLRKNSEEIKELIDTITSKTLAGEISKEAGIDLLSDLMATNVLDKVDAQKEKELEVEKSLSLSKEVLDKEQLEKIKEVKEDLNTENDIKLKNADTDFYTRSMDLSDKDFEMDDEFFEEKTPIFFKIITAIIIIVAITIAGYFIWQNFR